MRRETPERAYFVGQDVILTRLSNLPLLWKLSSIALLVFSVSGTLALGASVGLFIQHVRIEQIVDPVVYATNLKSLWITLSAIAALTLAPAVISVTMLMTVASVRKQRRMASALVEKLTGLKSAVNGSSGILHLLDKVA